MWFAEGVGKRVTSGDQAGWSAGAEGFRAGRANARYRLVNVVCVVMALALALAGVIGRDVWWVVGAAAAGAVGWWARPEPDPERWLRGAEGEVATARILATLPPRFVVFHDRHLPGRSGNIDHLVVGPSGVWVIDSKARRARLRVRFGQVWAGDHALDPGPAARQSDAVSVALGTPVAALLAVHGRGLRRRGKTVNGVRIIPAHRLRRCLRRGRRLTRVEVTLLSRRANHLFAPRR